MRRLDSVKIGIVAPSSKIPPIELKLGVERIRQEGLIVEVHSQCRKSHLFFAGTDSERAGAFFEFAQNPDFSAIWCARGGHGAIRLLPLLDQMTQTHGVPQRKLLVGYSDVTALMEYVRCNWGWATLHAPMPSMRKFSLLESEDVSVITQWISQEPAKPIWSKKPLNFWTSPPSVAIQAPLVGGNLTVWNCLLGTPYEAKAKGSLLFLEDVDESLYRIDRMLQQLALTDSIRGVQGVVLGNFMNCRDYSPQVLKSEPSRLSARARKRMLEAPKPHELKSLRKVFHEITALKQIFGEWGDRLNIPVAFGLPVGHGPEVSPLPLGAEYRLSPNGEFSLLSWDWLSERNPDRLTPGAEI